MSLLQTMLTHLDSPECESSEQAPRLIHKEPEKPSEPPKNNWTYPENEAWNCIQQVSAEALAKVDAIKEEAMSKKWSEARLYQNQDVPQP